ncbi:Oidioi.mRNA.OKI2018_I69.chr1.g3844.t1.cds [Oikopleura dioica]|uniref:Oidioi.mRNA.OKI2018_I69.chr1.g3844.t1.cds n=1 Tax=Oikopleura dioica TaxID=34765 RepID=A0ABN7SX40_OIKDI|nr:Oidioi.mRNA.OKI2018_I69.chr1.g3844.t1.cds [Oikopleura dioica]
MTEARIESFKKRLRALTESANCIETCSLWLLHHRKFAKHAAQTWYEELKKSKPRKQLTLLYLANDVLQNGRRKGNVPEYISYFRASLPKALSIIGKDPAIKPKALRVINIWEQRSIFSKENCLSFKKNLSSSSASSDSSSTIKRLAIGSPPKSSETPVKKIKKTQEIVDMPISPATKTPEAPTPSPVNSKPASPVASSKTSSVDESNEMLSFLNSSNVVSSDEEEDASDVTSVVSNSVSFLPFFFDQNKLKELTDEDFIAQIEKVAKDPPSADASRRNRIANLPPEVQEPGCLEALRQNNKLEPLVNMIDFGYMELAEYTKSLDEEIEDRKQLNLYNKTLRERVQSLQDDSRDLLQETHRKVDKVKKTIADLDLKIQSLPDLTTLSQLSKPLPKLNDLFT